MNTHQFATFLDKLRDAFGGLKNPMSAELAEVSAVFRELPDQSLKEFVKAARKAAAPTPAKGTPVDLQALIGRIRAVREGSGDAEAVAAELATLPLNNNHLKDILKAFDQKGTTGIDANRSKVRGLLQPGIASGPPPAPVADPQAVEEAHRLYHALVADRKLSITDLRAGFVPMRAYPKPVIEELYRRIGYTPAGSRDALLDKLLDKLEGIKMNQHRADRILTGTDA